MWRILIPLVMLAAAAALGETTFGQEVRQPYGPYDAIAEGTQSSELRRLSLIDSQLDTVDQLRSSIVPVAQPRALLRRADVAVYPYGRRGVLGLRAQGYVVVPRSPAVVYRRTYLLEPPLPPVPPEVELGYPPYVDESVRQPIGHESLQTGPNRWEYRPLYADDDRQLDETHGEIERNLAQGDNEPGRNSSARFTTTRPGNDSDAASDPEELPVPSDAVESSQARPAVRGQARDIARSAAFAEPRRDAQTARPTATGIRRDSRVPPPPRPDPPDQPANSPDNAKATPENAEPRGPVLQNPSTGAREF